MIRSKTPPRLIHDVSTSSTGPLLIILGGIHGNEPAGVKAMEGVLEKIEEAGGPQTGRIVGLRGNRQALALRERFLDHDLNRMWTHRSIQTIKETPWLALNAEQREIVELLDIFRDLDQTDHEPKVLLDLHTTSAPGGHFSVVEDDDTSIQLAATLQAPVITGLTKALAGTTASYCVDQGWAGLVFEAGQHHDPRAVLDHEAALWTLLHWLDMLPDSLHNKALRATTHLHNYSKELPAFVQVVYRHAIKPEDHFRMRPGYVNFQHIKAGEILADDRQGPVEAPYDGMMLMPLYQPQGADGFFIIQSLSDPKAVPS